MLAITVKSFLVCYKVTIIIRLSISKVTSYLKNFLVHVLILFLTSIPLIPYCTDVNLEPYSLYEYSIEVVNSAGESRSKYVNIRTLTAVPMGVNPPTPTIDPAQVYIIYLTWSIPQRPNGLLFSSTFITES